MDIATRRIGLLSKRITRLENRLNEDISLIRDEFYLSGVNNISSKQEQSGVAQGEFDKQRTAMEEELKKMKERLAEKLEAFGTGISTEKRVRREIQNEVCELRSETGDVANSITKLSDVIQTKLDVIIGEKSVNEKLVEIAELLGSINARLSDNAQPMNVEYKQTVHDCSDWLRLGYNESGVYTVFPEFLWRPLDVFCDMETSGGGWTVFQRRKVGSENFRRRWIDYAFGFGQLTDEFWLGNEYIHRLTSRAPHELLIELEDFENDHRYAAYGIFSIESAADFYRLHVDFFTGNVTDAMINKHNGATFSTFDHGPNTGCADAYKGGWWYNTGHMVNINGLYLKGKHSNRAQGMSWYHWRGYYYSMKTTEMKFRPH